MTDDLEKLRQDAIEADRCFSKSRLRDEFRMKPKPDAEPVKFYKNDFGKSFGVYRIADCVPMRQVKATRSEKQKAAAQRLAAMAKLDSKAAKAGKVAADWLADQSLILDTETTGLGEDAQVIEIAICDIWGTVLVDQRVRPSVPIDPAATEVHGITLDDLADCPTWPEVIDSIKELLTGRTVVIFNSGFDMAMLRNTCRAFAVDDSWLNTLNVKCAMDLAVQAFGSTNRHGTISLANATHEAGVSWPGEAHSAKVDALVTLDLVAAIYRCYLDPMAELKAL
ncbi:MAG: 3'-5' exonuclease [Porticoccaceae bacterium]|nr:3'-5' exonuclease [Porticoccaceae bacterium]